VNEGYVIGLGSSAMWTAIQVGAPILVLVLIIGLAISALQAVTQINEASLAFVPKLIALIAALAFFGPWMLHTLVDYTMLIFNALPQVAAR
jgi:flagellar biosynthetic protein FliQ